MSERPDLKDALHRLGRFVEGEAPRTVYPLKQPSGWRFDAMRRDVDALIAALRAAKAEATPSGDA